MNNKKVSPDVVVETIKNVQITENAIVVSDITGENVERTFESMREAEDFILEKCLDVDVDDSLVDDLMRSLVQMGIKRVIESKRKSNGDGQ